MGCGSICEVFIYSSMIAVLLMILLFHESFELLLLSINIDVRENKENTAQSQNIKQQIPFKLKLSAAMIVGVLGLIFFIKTSKESKNFQKRQERKEENPEYSKPVIANFTPDKKKYNYMIKSTTEKELAKLKQNPKFRKMLEERGTEEKNWNSRLIEKERQAVWREGDESCNSDEDLSNI